MVELLVVMGIIGMIMAVVVPSVSSLQNAGKLAKAASDIQGVMEQARSYAMANNTYVYVGIQEVDGMNPGASNGIGQVVLAVVASKDGTRPYSNTPGPLPIADIIPLGKAQTFDSIHLTNAASLKSSLNMSRPVADVDLGSTNSQISFQLPLSGTAKNTFINVVEFDPQGVPRYQTNTIFDPTVDNYFEIAVVPAHGNVALPNSANQAAIQIDGITGAVRLYRP